MAGWSTSCSTSYGIGCSASTWCSPSATRARACRVLDALAQKELKAGRRLPAAVPEAAAAASTTTACSPRRSRAGRSCSATTSTARSGAARVERDARAGAAQGHASPGRNVALHALERLRRQPAGLLQDARRRRALQPARRRRRRDRAACRCCVEFDGAYYEALSLAMVRTLLGCTSGGAPAAGGRAGLPQGAATTGPGMARGRAAHDPGRRARRPRSCRTAATARSFPLLSLADVLAGPRRAGAAEGQVALVGTTAPGLLDLRATPVDSVYPGVEIHANLIAGMLDAQHQAEAALHARRRGGAAAGRRHRARVLIPMLSALLGDAGRASPALRPDRRRSTSGLAAGATWCCRSPPSLLMTLRSTP